MSDTSARVNAMVASVIASLQPSMPEFTPDRATVRVVIDHFDTVSELWETIITIAWPYELTNIECDPTRVHATFEPDNRLNVCMDVNPSDDWCVSVTDGTF